METDEQNLPPEGATVEDLSVLPIVQAARSLLQCIRPFDRDITKADVERDLRLGCMTAISVHDEEMLYAQARLLDSMFNRAVVKALTGTRYDNKTNAWVDDDTLNYIDRNMASLALRMQSNCRHTLQALRARAESVTEKE